ncbi:hypothetical protein LSCM1_06336 [Leishmania martiniquensis]|uniref:Uncharacterized protein n=1 Tax=Leishmania martiniquensis TaxID=1580590 RepID=A0A836H6V4_9TRYP|nr:hypothetical protein LSCM1_06336 [Leishmania martiniquensis]
MKRARCIDARVCQRKRQRTHSMPLLGDCVRHLAKHLGSCETVVVMDPLACVRFHEEIAACTALEAFSLLLFEKHCEGRTGGMCGHRQTWWGIGVLRGRESDVAYNSGAGACVLWNIVPLALTLVPWQVKLPSRLQDLVLCQGHFASMGECKYGSSDVGPVPDSFVAREAVALLCGLPRCRVQAISGHFPMFRRASPPTLLAVPHAVSAADTAWSLVPSEEVEPPQREAAAHQHAQRLMSFVVSGLSSLMESSAPRNGRPVPECWAVVSYPDGLPRAASARDEVDSASRDIRDTARGVPVHDLCAPQLVCPCEAAPFFILPSHRLSQSLRVAVGWGRIPPSSRPVAEEALRRLCSLVDRAALCTDQGVTLTFRTAWDGVRQTRSATATIQRASSM